MNFMSTDRFIKYFNARNPNIKIIYSTPGTYLQALREQGETYPIKTDDMFPYADGPQVYWTGYYTSRANAKGYIRTGQANLHASSKLYSLKAID